MSIVMSIKSAIHDSGIPMKIREFSLEMLEVHGESNAFIDVISCRMTKYYGSKKYHDLHNEYKTLSDRIKDNAPEFKKLLDKIDDLVVSKEVDAFNEGYQAGMADLATALTFNNLQITHTQIIDTDAIRQAKRCL